MFHRILRVLAERSRRGVVASWVLAAVALIGVAIAFIVLFPGREGPRVGIGLASGGPDVDYPSPLRVWPGMRVLVRGQEMTPGGSVDVLVSGRRAGSFVVAPSGELRAIVSIPDDEPAGPTTLTVEDLGTGRSAGARLDVQDPGQPAMLVHPAAAASGTPVVVAAGGLLADVAVRVVLDPATDRVVLRTRRTTRTGLLLVVATLPGNLAAGEHTVAVETALGVAATPAVSLRIGA